MIKLIDLLKEVQEGVKVTFDDKGTANDIQISYSPIEGEELQTIDGSEKHSHYRVYYSLESAPNASNIKASQDALKYQPNLINSSQIESLLSKTVKLKIPKVDYIASLESTGGLNELLVTTLKKLYGIPDENVVPIAKMEFVDIKHAVDWDRYNKDGKVFQGLVDKFIAKMEEKPGPYKIRKSGEIESKIIQRLHSKYNLGLNPNIENQSLPPIYDIFFKCITQGKTLLVVDDNIHTGNDFYKLFKAVEDLAIKLAEEGSAHTEEEKETIAKIERAKGHEKYKNSKFLQDQVKDLENTVKAYYERAARIKNAYSGSNNRISGYVLYKLKDSDLKK